MVAMPRPPLPSDDLYARLGVPLDASVEAIEIAWRGLLRRHHPDVAGDEGLELAKRINVAHDWLSDPVLRARYDRERGLRHAVGPRGDGRGPWHARGPAPGPVEPEPPRPAGRRRGADPEVAIRRFLERIESLTATDIDRLSLAEPPPIAFGATIRRFLPPAQRAALDDVEARVACGPPGGRRPADHPRRDRRLRDRARPRLVPRRAAHRAVPESCARAPDPRLGCGRRPTPLRAERRGRRGLPAAASAELDAAGLTRLAATGVGLPAEDPWPGGLTPEDDDGLRVSSALAGRDAVAAIPVGPDGPVPPRARRAAARLAHLLVLRHAFAPTTFADLTAPGVRGCSRHEAPPPPVRRPVRSS